MSTQGYDPSEDRGPLLMGVCYAFYALTLIIYIARMSTRVYPKFSMTAADYTITMAMVSPSGFPTPPSALVLRRPANAPGIRPNFFSLPLDM